jgi:hypothetical protein
MDVDTVTDEVLQAYLDAISRTSKLTRIIQGDNVVVMGSSVVPSYAVSKDQYYESALRWYLRSRKRLIKWS